MNILSEIKRLVKEFPQGMKKTWEAFKYFFTKDWKFALPILVIVGIGVWLTIREINYDKWYGEETKDNKELVIDSLEVIKADTLNLE